MFILIIWNWFLISVGDVRFLVALAHQCLYETVNNFRLEIGKRDRLLANEDSKTQLAIKAQQPNPLDNWDGTHDNFKC